MDDLDTILKPLANHLRPMLVTSWNERRKAMLAENSDRMKRVLDNLQKKLDEVSSLLYIAGRVSKTSSFDP